MSWYSPPLSRSCPFLKKILPKSIYNIMHYPSIYHSHARSAVRLEFSPILAIGDVCLQGGLAYHCCRSDNVAICSISSPIRRCSRCCLILWFWLLLFWCHAFSPGSFQRNGVVLLFLYIWLRRNRSFSGGAGFGADILLIFRVLRVGLIKFGVIWLLLCWILV